MNNPEALLQPPSGDNPTAPERLPSPYVSLDTFKLPKGSEKKYSTQYADLYFVRLALLKRFVEQVAEEAWGEFEISGEKARRVERVLDVRQGELCWVVGTVFMEMSLKPNILEDLSKEHWIISPTPREKYIKDDGTDEVMLEDESGRLALAGKNLLQYALCTGCIVAVIGTENANGAFEVIDVKFPDLPPQPERWALHDSILKTTPKTPSKGKVAIVSGLEMNGVNGDTMALELLSEYLLGEVGDSEETARISRLIIAGNSLADASPIPTREELALKKSLKKYGTDPTSWNATPAQQLDRFLSTLLPSIPITLIPGASDPANVSVPQLPLHAALFPHSRAYTKPHGDDTPNPSWFDSVTNPWEGEVDGWRFLGTGGQPVNDMFKYAEGNDRIQMMENFLRWRNVAPTAPDTLWTYPFQDKDPFVIKECPHVYIVGNQPRTSTAVIEGPDGQKVRLITVPSFKTTGIMVLLDTETLEIECVDFKVFGEDPAKNGMVE